MDYLQVTKMDLGYFARVKMFMDLMTAKIDRE